jgi:hypothetical protein
MYVLRRLRNNSESTPTTLIEEKKLENYTHNNKLLVMPEQKTTRAIAPYNGRGIFHFYRKNLLMSLACEK